MMRAGFVVLPEPGIDGDLSLLCGVEPLRIQTSRRIVPVKHSL